MQDRQASNASIRRTAQELPRAHYGTNQVADAIGEGWRTQQEHNPAEFEALRDVLSTLGRGEIKLAFRYHVPFVKRWSVGKDTPP